MPRARSEALPTNQKQKPIKLEIQKGKKRYTEARKLKNPEAKGR